jgi:hypothetical protein
MRGTWRLINLAVALLFVAGFGFGQVDPPPEVKIDPDMAGPLPCEMKRTEFTFKLEGYAETAWGPGHMKDSFAADYAKILETEFEARLSDFYRQWLKTHKCTEPCTRMSRLIGDPTSRKSKIEDVTSSDGKKGKRYKVTTTIRAVLDCHRPG